MKIKCLIVDDEELALDVLENFISQVEFLQLEARCKTAIEALTVLNKKKIDLMFLDIQMPELTGIQLLRSVSHAPEVILTTAYSNYAIEAFELEVLDYLLKPIPFERFLKAVNRFSAKHAMPLQNNEGAAAKSASFYVKCDKQMVNIMLNDILYIESIRNYVVIKLKNKKEIKTLSTISSIEKKLSENDFLRIHRSFIVALNKIESFNGGGVTAGGMFLPFGRNYKNYAFNLLLKSAHN
jgi:DNA-binding LytR/AlgR family response regulator